MPELPDVTIYVECLERLVAATKLERLRFTSPFVLRSVDPPPAEFEGLRVRGVRRLGKRIVFEFEPTLEQSREGANEPVLEPAREPASEVERFAVLHLMIAGRLQWQPAGKAVPKKIALATFEFERGTLVFTEAGSKKRASIHLVRGRAALAEHDRGGLEPLDAALEQFRASLARENRTLKRALTDPRLFSGIGNAYSDEILHRARLSPLRLTSQLDAGESAQLHRATIDVLGEWTQRLRAETGDRFPKRVTAFRAGMAVHGRFGEPCPVCGAPVQRIAYASNEANYCARCQTAGRLLADRALSKLMKDDWPRTLEELEERKGRSDRRTAPYDGQSGRT